MEKFTINKNTPKMSYSDIVSLDDSERIIELLEDKEHIRISNPYRRHHAALGETIYFRKRSGTPNEQQKDWGVYSMVPVVVTDIEDEFTIITTAPEYNKVYHIVSAEVETNVITFDDQICFLPEDFEVTPNVTATLYKSITESEEILSGDTIELGRFYPVYRHMPGADVTEYDPYYDREYINTVSYSLDASTNDLKGDILPIISRYAYDEIGSYICLPDDVTLDSSGDFVDSSIISGLGGEMVNEVPEAIDILDSDPDLIYIVDTYETCYHEENIVASSYTYYTKVENYVFDYNKISRMPLVFNCSNFYYSVEDEYDDESLYRLYDTTDIVRNLMYYEIQTNISVSDEYNLLQQQTITDLFSEEIKSKIVPDFIDMEKYMFEPSIDGSGELMAGELIFNLHFRERDMHYEHVESPSLEMFKFAKEWDISNASINTPRYALYEDEYYERVYDDSWSTNDDTGWNCEDESAVTRSDLIGVLNFNEDDIKYQKMKLKKSFIRLSFYDSDNPLTQQLLYYSTIFMDSSDLFGKYVRNKTGKDGKYFGVFTEPEDGDEDKRLSTRISVKDKYNTDKSSEGFYLYLFGDEFNQNGEPKEIYMKVEFNHAGYGRTLPFTKPYMLSSAGVESEGIPFSKYFSTLYIKLGAKYKPYGDCHYIYYVDEEDNGAITYDMVNRTISFNLYEVKIA